MIYSVLKWCMWCIMLVWNIVIGGILVSCVSGGSVKLVSMVIFIVVVVKVGSSGSWVGMLLNSELVNSYVFCVRVSVSVILIIIVGMVSVLSVFSSSVIICWCEVFSVCSSVIFWVLCCV